MVLTLNLKWTMKFQIAYLFSLLGRSDTIKTEAIEDPPTRKGNRRT